MIRTTVVQMDMFLILLKYTLPGSQFKSSWLPLRKGMETTETKKNLEVLLLLHVLLHN